MWRFWWIFPLLGLLICAAFAFAMIRAMSGGRGFMCMGGHGPLELERQRVPRPGEHADSAIGAER